jgi:hypothetical protein
MSRLMNAERLHAIVATLLQELEETNYLEFLQQLSAGLTARVKSSNQPGPQQEVNTARANLNKALREAPSNNFSPAWNQALEEMGIADVVGESLLEGIETILTRNELTPKIAAREVETILNRVWNFDRSVRKASVALNFFQIGSEQLPPGEFEIGFLIPRGEVENGLEQLGREFVRLKKIVAPFSELAGEGRPEIEVRSISSSEFQVFLDSAPATAALFTFALQQVLKVYQQILDIRVKRQELAEKGDVPEDVLKPLVDHLSDRMKEAVKQITEEVIAKAQLEDQDRLNELRSEVTRQLNALAERIDRGFDIEVRAGEIPEQTEGEDEESDPIDPDIRAAAEAVLEAQRRIEFMNVSGKTILSLEPPEDPEEDEGDGNAPARDA